MSFQSWLQEFYPTSADEVARSTDLECVEHAIKAKLRNYSHDD